MTYDALNDDPADATVDEVTGALPDVSPEDVAAIKAAEEAGKARKGILEWTPNPSTAKADEDGYTRVLVEDAYQPGEPVEDPEPEDDTQE